MAVGDIVNVNMSGTEYYQPASGVEIMVLKNFGTSSAFSFGHSDGTLHTYTYHGTGTARYDDSGLGIKFGITNTHYYYNGEGSAVKGFSGIQTK